MEAFSNALLDIVAKVNSFLTDYILIILLVGIGLFYTIRTKFVQVRCFGEGMKQVFGGIFSKKDGAKGGLSSFQALATAVAAQVGTGNIVGACGAIIIGGPGAIFWMWVIAFFGMATIYAEATLAQDTKVVAEDGSVLGGPVYYIKKAFKGTFGKILAGFFAVATILALGFMGSMVQSNSIAGAVSNSIPSFDPAIVSIIVGLVLAIVCAFIFIGGIKRIASVAEKVVPAMAVLYIVLCLVVLGFNITKIPSTFGMIFKYAFNPTAIIGGGLGYALKQAISQGAKRGLFSNEAGMGSTPHAHAQAEVEKPHDQGVAAMIGVFVDTFVVLTMTALVVITTLYADGAPLAETVNKNNMMQVAMGTVFGTTAGNVLVAVCLTFFAFTTIISWNFFGKQNVEYMFGKKATVVYSVIAILFIFMGTVFKSDLVWELTDFFNYLMVLPNAIALFVLSGIVVGALKDGKKKKNK